MSELSELEEQLEEMNGTEQALRWRIAKLERILGDGVWFYDHYLNPKDYPEPAFINQARALLEADNDAR